MQAKQSKKGALRSTQNAMQAFLKLSDQAQNCCFLYSKERSILASNPVAQFRSDIDIEGFKGFVEKHKGNQIIGYLSYDLAYSLYDIPQRAKNDLALPRIFFLAFEQWEEFSNNQIEEIHLPKHTSNNFKAIISPTEYQKNYQRIKDYLKEGDIYQLNYTHRMEADTNLPSRLLFAKIIEQNPVEFGAYIEGNGFEILSASPERFIKIHDQKIETFPIKGTRPRGKTKQEDQKAQEELLESQKEAAELNMITDLLRNDLGKVCQIGSIQILGHRLLKKCPTVWHTYSQITGNLATKPIEALLSMLPAGSITGCPKKRAVEIIDELEPQTRGIYTGQIGHIEANGDLDFNIAIRTIIKKKQKLYLQVGGGIVNDSQKEEEYQETLDKAASFMKILC